jgi:hypothetical protein
MRNVTRWRAALIAAIVVFSASVAGSATAGARVRNAPSPNGRSYARLKDGATRQAVVSLLGRNFGVCPSCAPVTWIYTLQVGDPVAIVVRFRNGKVVSHFLVRPQSSV